MAKNNTGTKPLYYAIGLLRIGLGLIFAWAFADKLWGLGYATCRNPETGAVNLMCEQAWLSGGSPTAGFLQFASQGPFREFFIGLAGNTAVDWLFMAGMLLIGLSLVLGIGIGIAAFTGSILMLMMWLAVLPPQHHPFMDDHIIYVLVFMVILLANNSQRLGMGNWWAGRSLVKKYGWLK